MGRGSQSGVGLALLFLASIALGLLLLGQSRLPGPGPLQPSGGFSYNWAGYIVESDSQTPKPEVWSVSAKWAVPEVKVSGIDSFSAVWVGVGGQLESSLIQAGTEQDSIFGTPVYSVWYEVLPYSSVTVTSMTVSPGDVVTISISLKDAASESWLIKIDDISNGQSFNKTMSYSSSRLSAEWIVERPLVDGAFPPLASFTAITFQECKATIGNATGGIDLFPHLTYNLSGRTGRELASTSTPGINGSSFSVAFLSAE